MRKIVMKIFKMLMFSPHNKTKKHFSRIILFMFIKVNIIKILALQA